jgi:hypothetical protein
MSTISSFAFNIFLRIVFQPFLILSWWMSTDIVICILYALQLRIYRTTYIHARIHTHTQIEAIFYFLFTEQFLASFYLHFFTFPLLHLAHSSACSERSTAGTNTYIYKYTERETTKEITFLLIYVST